MPQLAHNERTAANAAIKRASARARFRMRQLDTTSQQQITDVYRRASEELKQIISSYAGTDGSIRLDVMQDLLGQVNRSLDQLTRTRDELLDDALQQSASLGVQPYSGSLPGDFLTRAADEALNFVNSFVMEDGLQLSDRLWRLDNNARELVGTSIQSAIIQGHSASQAANDFLNRGAPVPRDIASKLGMANADNIARVSAAALVRGNTSPRAQALRVFRTEINRAHGEAYMISGEEGEDFGGWRFLLSPRHPKTDICDMHARANRFGLGPGVYPARAKTPWPAHPNTLSFIEIVFSDEITDEDREGKESALDWLKNQPGHVQEGVLNSRKKRALLQRGLLRENEIATPWNVLKRRLERRGFDVSDLAPKPEANFRDLPINDIRQEAYEYVTTQGERTGWEYAVAYDIDKRTEFLRKTSRSPSSVGFNRHELAIFQNPNNKLELVHNHPSSSSLSGADLNFATQPGVSAIVAVGHSGTIYRAQALTSAQLMTAGYSFGNRSVDLYFRRSEVFSSLSINEKNTLFQHMLMESLNKADFISYNVNNISGTLADVIDKVGPDFVDDIAQRAADDILYEVADRGLN